MSWLDTTRHPLDAMRFPMKYTHAELRQEFDALDAHYLRLAEQQPSARVALIVDISAVSSSDARNRQRIGESFVRLAPMLERQTVGQAFVVRHPLARGALQAVFWFRRPPWPTTVVATY